MTLFVPNEDLGIEPGVTILSLDLVIHEQVVNRLIPANLLSDRCNLEVVKLLNHKVLGVCLEESKHLSVSVSARSAHKSAIHDNHMSRSLVLAVDAVFIERIL